MWGYGYAPGAWLGVLGMWLFLALVIAAGVWVVARWRPLAPGEPRDAFAILDRRYAAGEITRDEFLRMRDDLAGRPPRA